MAYAAAVCFVGIFVAGGVTLITQGHVYSGAFCLVAASFVGVEHKK